MHWTERRGFYSFQFPHDSLSLLTLRQQTARTFWHLIWQKRRRGHCVCISLIRRGLEDVGHIRGYLDISQLTISLSLLLVLLVSVHRAPPNKTFTWISNYCVGIISSFYVTASRASFHCKTQASPKRLHSLLFCHLLLVSVLTFHKLLKFITTPSGWLTFPCLVFCFDIFQHVVPYDSLVSFSTYMSLLFPFRVSIAMIISFFSDPLI